MQIVIHKNHIRHPILAHRAFKKQQFQARLNSEYVKMHLEIKKHGHILLTGVAQS